MIIDLHLTKDIIESPYFDPKNSLYIQLDMFEKELDNAIVANVPEWHWRMCVKIGST